MLSEEYIDQLKIYREGVLTEFISHFKIRFKKLEQSQPEWLFEIEKWNLFGVLLVQINILEWAERFYKSLYNLLSELQSSGKGRINKGTPLHNMGWVNFIQGTALSMKRSEYFVKLAMIEDILSDKSNYKNTPAYKLLAGELNVPLPRLEKLADHTIAYNNNINMPELVYMNYVIEPDSYERTNSWDFNTFVASYLFQQVNNAKDSNSKGNSLELLMAYLFLSSQGFEVLRRVRSFDSEVDLIIRNLRANEPIMCELGQYILVECKNTENATDAKAIRDFAMKVIISSCNSGIVISKKGVTGENNKNSVRDAALAIIKIHQRNNVVVFPISFDKIEQVIKRQITFDEVIISAYEKSRFEIP